MSERKEWLTNQLEERKIRKENGLPEVRTLKRFIQKLKIKLGRLYLVLYTCIRVEKLIVSRKFIVTKRLTDGLPNIF